MARDNYESDSLIGKYISACDRAEHALDNIQIGLLEKTLIEAFGIKKNRVPPADDVKKIDMGILEEASYHISSSCGKVVNILKKYRENNLGLSDDIPPTEADAWSLYSLTIQEIGKTTYPILNKYTMNK